MLLNPYRFIKPLSQPENARYWRIYIRRSNGTGYVAIDELVFREMAGQPPNGSGGTGVTGSSESQAVFYAFDGGYYGVGASWRSVGNPQTDGPEYLVRDYQSFGGESLIRHVDIRVQDNSHAPADFDLQFSHDLVTWKTCMEVRGQDIWAAGEWRGFSV